MRHAIAGSLATAFALAAIAAAPLAVASPDNEFLNALSDSGITYPPQATPRIINGGHTICQNFAKDGSYEDAVSFAAGGLGGNQRLAGAFVRAAATSLCPDYVSQLP
jgi:Protein of unknown function (DUF732)